MSCKWSGSLDTLKSAVTFTGRVGDWLDGTPIEFRAGTGEILRYYPSTKTVQFQGAGTIQFEAELEEELGLKRRALEFGE
jgi:hypothetical protein